MRWTSIVLVIGLVGCSAGRAAVAMVQADRALSNARNQGAEAQAAYEMRMAEAYLTKAREEAHFSSYRTSVDLARDAADWADKAIIEMEKRGTEGARSNADAPGGVQGTPDAAPPSGEATPEVAQPATAAPPVPPKKDPWAQPGVAPTPPSEPTPAPSEAPQAPAPAEPESAAPPKIIVVPVDPTPAPPPPKLRVIPVAPEPPADEDDGEEAP